nr:thiamine diphosphokinase [uncultured Mogibacterium sp.]
MYNTALIILSFIEKTNVSQLNASSSASDYIVCADGGVDVATQYGIRPDCVIGDFDSTNTNNRLDCLYITLPSEKDLTDTEAAINHAIELGISDITVYGGIGGRLDHTLGNVGLLEKYLGRLEHLKFIDGKNSMQLLDSEVCSSAMLTPDSSYKYFSLIPLDSTAEGVTITGAKYCLDNVSISRSSTLCISNEISCSHAHISVRSGKVLLVRSGE